MNYKLKRTMMHKLTQLGQVILIGLSSILLIGCPGNPFAIDDLDESFDVFYLNESSKKIILHELLQNMNSTSLVIESNSSNRMSIPVVISTGVKPITKYVDYLSMITLVIDNDTLVRWSKPSGYFGDIVNSPFNYDSWVYEALEADANNVVGKITFTITDKDLE